MGDMPTFRPYDCNCNFERDKLHSKDCPAQKRIILLAQGEQNVFTKAKEQIPFTLGINGPTIGRVQNVRQTEDGRYIGDVVLENGEEIEAKLDSIVGNTLKSNILGEKGLLPPLSFEFINEEQKRAATYGRELVEKQVEQIARIVATRKEDLLKGGCSNCSCSLIDWGGAPMNGTTIIERSPTRVEQIAGPNPKLIVDTDMEALCKRCYTEKYPMETQMMDTGKVIRPLREQMEAAGMIDPEADKIDKYPALSSALNGSAGEDQRRIAEEGLRWIDLILRKNRDYGISVFESPMLCPGLDPGVAILVRMTDKIKRLQSLQTNKRLVTKESFDDTIQDLGAYCLLYLCRPKG